MRPLTSRRQRTAVVLGTLCALASDVAQAAQKYPWEKPPGPIAGSWKTSCAGSAGMVINFVLEGDKKAVGRIAELGAAGKYGYKRGEEIFRLSATDLGKWVGQLKWRSVAGALRWEPISFVASPDRLDAVATMDDCYKSMLRAH